MMQEEAIMPAQRFLKISASDQLLDDNAAEFDGYFDPKTRLVWAKDDLSTDEMDPKKEGESAAPFIAQGWRISTIEDLDTIIDRKLYFPATQLPGIQPKWYRAASTCAGLPGVCRYVNFYFGDPEGITEIGHNARSRLVRGPVTALPGQSLAATTDL